jgi:glycerol uptake facilitator-like aquaporin
MMITKGPPHASMDMAILASLMWKSMLWAILSQTLGAICGLWEISTPYSFHQCSASKISHIAQAGARQ